MSGTTIKVTSASFQFMFSMMARMNGQHEDVLEDGDDAGGEHFVQRIHVGGDAGDQPSDGILVEEGDVHVLQVAENLAAEVEHHLLPGPLHQVSLQEFKHKSEKQQADVEATDLGDAGQGRAAQAVADPGVAHRAIWPGICRWRSW